MNLIIDIGNTLIKAYLFKNNELYLKFSNAEFEYIKKFIEQYKINIQYTIISSVIEINDNIIIFLKENFNYCIFLDEKTSVPINNYYHTPETLGRDRLASVIGAGNIFPHTNVLVVDLGTAIKYDFIDEHNNYFGGAISPGLLMRFKALHKYTGKLPYIESKSDFNDILGVDSEKSILSGVQNGILFEIQGFIDYFENNFKEIKIVLTGGDSFFFENKLKKNIFVEPNLVAIGLNCILENNYAK